MKLADERVVHLGDDEVYRSSVDDEVVAEGDVPSVRGLHKEDNHVEEVVAVEHDANNHSKTDDNLPIPGCRSREEVADVRMPPLRGASRPAVH